MSTRELEILNRDAEAGGVEGGGVEGQGLVGVEVLDEAAVEAWVGGELIFVQAVAGDAGIRDIIGQVADPAAHEVEDDAAGGERVAVEGGDRVDGGVVDVGDEAGVGIEERVGGAVLSGEGFGWEIGKLGHAPDVGGNRGLEQ